MSADSSIVISCYQLRQHVSLRQRLCKFEIAIAIATVVVILRVIVARSWEECFEILRQQQCLLGARCFTGGTGFKRGIAAGPVVATEATVVVMAIFQHNE